MVLELNEKEREVLKLALEIMEDELKDERVRTDKKVYRSALNKEGDVLKSILRKVA